MITCHRCNKENQDHYKFCLGCGAELTGAPRSPAGDVGMMKTMMADVGRSPTPPRGFPAPGGNPFAGGPGSPAMGGLPGGPPLGAPPPGPPPAGPPPGVPTASTAAVMPPPDDTADERGMGRMRGPGGPGWAGSPATPPMGGPMPGARPMTQPSGPNMSRGADPRSSAPRVCPNCSAMVPPEFKFCGVCGTKALDAAPSPVSSRDGSQPVAKPRPSAYMTLIRPDGSEGGVHNLLEGENVIGRSHGEIFENDGYLSPTHAALVIRGKAALIRDLDSLNGVFVKMTEEEEIGPGQVIRIGQELLRFDAIDPPEALQDGTEVMGSPNPGYWGKITVIIGKDIDGSAYPLLGDSVTLGRERGDINFPDDGYVSGLHARLSNQDGQLILTDLGSSNGTFIKVKSERGLKNDSFVLLGQQLFRISL